MRLAVIGGSLSLMACAPHVYTLVPDKASAGRLQHAVDGAGSMTLSYAGKTYSGAISAERSRRIHGKHQRHLGRIARSTLTGPDGEALTCDVQWPYADQPTGHCNDAIGVMFPIRFE